MQILFFHYLISGKYDSYSLYNLFNTNSFFCILMLTVQNKDPLSILLFFNKNYSMFFFFTNTSTYLGAEYPQIDHFESKYEVILWDHYILMPVMKALCNSKNLTFLVKLQISKESGWKSWLKRWYDIHGISINFKAKTHIKIILLFNPQTFIFRWKNKTLRARKLTWIAHNSRVSRKGKEQAEPWHSLCELW